MKKKYSAPTIVAVRISGGIPILISASTASHNQLPDNFGGNGDDGFVFNPDGSDGDGGGEGSDPWDDAY